MSTFIERNWHTELSLVYVRTDLSLPHAQDPGAGVLEPADVVLGVVHDGVGLELVGSQQPRAVVTADVIIMLLRRQVLF